MKTKYIVMVICAFAIAGCTTKWKAEVISDTSWSGSFHNRTVAGSGNQSVDLGGDDIVCCSVQKETERGSLSVQVKYDGNSPFRSDEGEKVTTTAPFGIVTACNK